MPAAKFSFIPLLAARCCHLRPPPAPSAGTTLFFARLLLGSHGGSVFLRRTHRHVCLPQRLGGRLPSSHGPNLALLPPGTSTDLTSSSISPSSVVIFSDQTLSAPAMEAISAQVSLPQRNQTLQLKPHPENSKFPKNQAAKKQLEIEATPSHPSKPNKIQQAPAQEP
ncbi:hypothetical protein ABZP36_020182 [Zizania latifolia]